MTTTSPTRERVSPNTAQGKLVTTGLRPRVS